MAGSSARLGWRTAQPRGVTLPHKVKYYLERRDPEFDRKLRLLMWTNRPKVERTVDRALRSGVEQALDDLPRTGRPREISDEARAWVVDLACRKPTQLGYSEELWTTARLASHIRANCVAAGHPSLARGAAPAGRDPFLR